ncbi:hypothetical protein DYD21_16735 [Rhodohalobacter sp. SW132]|uniref:hypothetical protein n=1 Tax=Rhodohalobacter sp. SW132 TaxID=2293433 RepID=UPI000E3A62C6|nr:hypothetical protein [Rhodohalobacter sp. SW132]REL24807.1 hypothetical protein DYD21_16735 [Rhodohalobacter sp. SW132]
MAGKYRKEKELSYISLRIVAGIPLFTEIRLIRKMSNGLRWCCDRRGLRIYEYVILPDRILLMGNAAWGTFDEIIESFKAFSSKAVMQVLREGRPSLHRSWLIPLLEEHGNTGSPAGTLIWSSEDHKRVVYQQHDIDATAMAIRYAPVKQGIVSKEKYYLHSSANPANPLEGWQVAVTDRGI